ncbi:MAG: chemotaxis protein, partial [Tepidisphaeraceae bacterium]
QMDKVTQSNAANAEESASASEELSSQAEQMKAMVGELIALVNGASGRGPASPAHPAKHHATAAHAGKAKGSDAIPFDNEPAHAGKGDFHAFNKAA